MTFRLSILSLVSALSLVATSAAAQEKPYAPKKQQPSELIQRAAYEEPPIVFEQWALMSTDQVVNGERLDFRLVYDADYQSVVDLFADAYKHRKVVSKIRPEIIPHAKNPDLIVFGTQIGGEKSRFTIGHPELPYSFMIDVAPDDMGKTVIIIQNAVYSMLYSGVMPARADFQPAKADPIPFRWN